MSKKRFGAGLVFGIIGAVLVPGFGAGAAAHGDGMDGPVVKAARCAPAADR